MCLGRGKGKGEGGKGEGGMGGKGKREGRTCKSYCLVCALGFSESLRQRVTVARQEV